MNLRFLIIALVVVVVMLQRPLWFGNGSIVTLWRLHQEVEVQKQENAHLDERNQVLAAEVIDLKKGLEAIQERARWELGMVKDSETFYQIVEREAPPGSR